MKANDIIPRKFLNGVLIAIVILCTGCHSGMTKMFMTKSTKALYTEICDDYNWKVPHKIAEDDIDTFARNINQSSASEVTMVTVSNFQNKSFDALWESEKKSLNDSYGKEISGLNKVQRTLLYEELNRYWQDYVKKYRYNYVLYANFQNCSKYVNLIEEARQDSIAFAAEYANLTDRTSKLRSENDALNLRLNDLQNEQNRLLDEKSQLKTENRNLLKNQELNELSLEITELEESKVPKLVAQYNASLSHKTYNETIKHRQIADELADSLDRLIFLCDKAYSISLQIGSSRAQSFKKTYDHTYNVRANLREKIGY